MSENEVSSQIIGAAIEVHKHLGPGLLESSYEACLLFELRQRGLNVKSQVSLPISYKGFQLETGYRIDILVEEKVIIEIKAVDELADIHTAQILTYLQLTNLKLGLLINFNSVKLVMVLREWSIIFNFLRVLCASAVQRKKEAFAPFFNCHPHRSHPLHRPLPCQTWN